MVDNFYYVSNRGFRRNGGLIFHYIWCSSCGSSKEDGSTEAKKEAAEYCTRKFPSYKFMESDSFMKLGERALESCLNEKEFTSTIKSKGVAEQTSKPLY
tara:strand:+ start:204 stop:500 length:297 start_codon:yes stop_codon:yes gene_type:complete